MFTGCLPGVQGNWTAVAGAISATKSLNLLSLTGTYSSIHLFIYLCSLVVIGFAVILHSTTDDCVVVASSGTRLAQCVCIFGFLYLLTGYWSR